MQINSINKFQNVTVRGKFQRNNELENILKWANQEELLRFKNNLERMAKVDDKKVYTVDRYDDWFSPEAESYKIAVSDLKFYEKNSEDNKERAYDFIECSSADSKLALINSKLEKLYPVNKNQTEDVKTDILNLLV